MTLACFCTILNIAAFSIHKSMQAMTLIDYMPNKLISGFSIGIYFQVIENNL